PPLVSIAASRQNAILIYVCVRAAHKKDVQKLDGTLREGIGRKTRHVAAKYPRGVLPKATGEDETGKKSQGARTNDQCLGGKHRTQRRQEPGGRRATVSARAHPQETKSVERGKKQRVGGDRTVKESVASATDDCPTSPTGRSFSQVGEDPGHKRRHNRHTLQSRRRR
ncbi:unnamed protein product, partial [Ixodes persulcatus]